MKVKMASGIASKFASVAAFGALFGAFVALGADELKGYYLTHVGDSGRQSVVEFFERGGKYYAYGFANVDGSGPKKDSINPNPALRERVDKGSVFVYGLKEAGKGEFKGGEVYNYDNGKTYNLKITKEKDGKLILRASIDKAGIMGQTLTWTPLTQEQIEKYEGEKPPFSVVEESFETLPQEFK
ncbi:MULTISPECIES: DUF2147 domain-containing protein [unclassified Helicobacter]|uniref:DUF2147 domain-containing protein n=1 Tax=unclassified Helicobacter TaxID=2593540 RepID=UPI000A568C51|nr:MULTISPECIES: DUF2147 domain-containing protein [unclassified Helicobacter]